MPHSLFQICDPLITGSWIIFQFHKVSYQPSELLLSRHFLTEMPVVLLPTAWIHSGCSHRLQQWCRTWFRTPLWVPSHHCPSCSLPCCWSLSGWWQQWQPAGQCVVTQSLDICFSFDPLLSCPYTDTQTSSHTLLHLIVQHDSWLLASC